MGIATEEQAEAIFEAIRRSDAEREDCQALMALIRKIENL